MGIDTLMNTTKKVDTFAPQTFITDDPKEPSTPMENGKSLSTFPMSIMPKDTAKDTKSTLKLKD